MHSTADSNLVIHAGRVLCPDSSWNAPGSVSIQQGRFVSRESDTDPSSRQVWRFPDAVLLPGLIDLHAHPAKGGSQWGVDPDQHLLPAGTTTVLSQGDAGADAIDEYVRETIEASRTRVRLAINLSRRGEAGPGGCFADLDFADIAACVAAVERHRRHIWGIAVNVSHHACEATDPHEILRRGIAAAERTNLPLLCGLRRPEDWPLAAQLELLRPGDVVTYCYRRVPHCIVRNGRVLPEVKAARERGILFDVGHGTNSFDEEVARIAILNGFPPDTISTDWQRAHRGQAGYGLPLVMSKLQAAGLSEEDVVRAVTSTPARILGLSAEIGSLQPGHSADVAVLQRAEGRWKPVLTVRAGRMIVPAAD